MSAELFTSRGMSPASHREPISGTAGQALVRMAVSAGQRIRDERKRRSWTMAELSSRAGVSRALVQAVEAGEEASLETYARLLTALDLRPNLVGEDPRDRPRGTRRGEDLVHAAMGELEAGRLRRPGVGLAMDEPYQHFQFAGRADVVAWHLERRALLHLENRTQFPNVQDALGAYGAKRTYLARVLAERLGVGPRGWSTVTHAMVALWSAEVLHTLRIRRETFRAACPDGAGNLVAWWTGRLDLLDDRDGASSLVLLDPSPDARDDQRLRPFNNSVRIKPRLRDYADAAVRLGSQPRSRPLSTLDS
jgi:transcriptional regulator with XRE-family HTH domain